MKQYLYNHKYMVDQETAQKLINFLSELLEADCSYLTEFHFYRDEDNQRIAEVSGLGECGKLEWGTF